MYVCRLSSSLLGMNTAHFPCFMNVVVCACVHVCVYERDERQREREGDGVRQGKQDTEGYR